MVGLCKYPALEEETLKKFSSRSRTEYCDSSNSAQVKYICIDPQYRQKSSLVSFTAVNTMNPGFDFFKSAG